MIDTRKTIIEVLSIINFTDDKEVFTDGILVMAEKQALTECIKSLPEHKRAPLIHLLNNTHRQRELSTILKRYITEEMYAKQLEKSTNELFLDYLETIDKTLDPETRAKLESYLALVLADSNRVG